MEHGLVGALTGAASSAQKLKHLDPLKWIVRLVVFAGIILIAKKAGVEFTWGNSAIVMLLGFAALLGEFYFSGEIARSWHERSIASIMAFALLWSCAFAYSVNQWLGAASDGQFEKAGIQKAAFVRTSDAAATEKELAANVERIQQKLKLAPQRTPDAAQAAIDNAKAHKFWKSTDGCKETKGPNTRDFCSNYASAVADKSLGTEAITLREELKVEQAKLANIRAERKNAPVAVSEERTDLRMYTKYMALSQDEAMDVQAVGTIIFISFVLSGLGILTESKKYRGQPSKPWGFWKAIKQLGYRIRRLIWGGAATPPEVHNHTVNVHGMQYHQMLAGKA